MRENAIRAATFRNELDHVILDRPPAGTVALDGECRHAVDVDDMRVLQPFAHLHFVEGFVLDEF